jgi:Skp family chaperone for outer membrane proteins
MLRRIGLVSAFLILATGIAVAQAPPDKVGVFDPESVWRLSDVGRKYNETLSNAANRLQERIEKKQSEEDKVQAMQRDAQTKRIELERLNTDAKREMNDQLNEVQGRFQRMLIETIQTFGKEENYTVILSSEVVGYSAPQADITQDLIAKFNEMHKVPPESASTTSSKSD